MARPPLQSASDADLLRVAGEEPEAFGVLYDRFEADVLAFFWRATQRSDVTADLTAETFAAALESAAGFNRELGSVRNWLFGIARHELVDAWRHGRVEDWARQRVGLEPLVLSDAELTRIEQLGGGQRAFELLAELPDDQQVAIRGRVIEERGYADLAQSLSCSQSVVRQR